jgi:hypothetical protein
LLESLFNPELRLLESLFNPELPNMGSEIYVKIKLRTVFANFFHTTQQIYNEGSFTMGAYLPSKISIWWISKVLTLKL